jgi:hypothetical protein
LNELMLSLHLLVLVAAAAGPTVTPFRTEVSPRVDSVFGDVASLRLALDQFLALQLEMEQVRNDFSTSVHSTLAGLMPVDNGTKVPAKSAATGSTCPRPALNHYRRALASGGKYLGLGRQLEARFREIHKSAEWGDSAGLTPDYRAKLKRARELYQELLRDYREMRVAFHDQLGAEMRFAGCDTSVRPKKETGAEIPDPADPAAWTLEEVAAEAPPAVEKEPPADVRETKPPVIALGSAPAVWITIDNSKCAELTQLSVDGSPLGVAPGHKKTSVRTRSGPHELCVLPSSDKRACGDPGTIRRAYLYEGWTLVVRCGP